VILLIEQSFCFLKGIGLNKEKSLWRQGIVDWFEFNKSKEIQGISLNRKKELEKDLEKAQEFLEKKDPVYFNSLLPRNQNWRLFNRFKKDAMFFDIESTGLGQWNKTTVVGTFFQEEFNAFIRGKNLSRENLIKEFNKAKLIVTFNGSLFDKPFLEREFRISINVPHIDLRFALKQLGFGGGLKSIEKQLGINRSEETQGMDGFEAVKLWQKYEKGSNHALEKLIQYNKEDVINMQPLMDFTYNELTQFIKSD